MTDRASTCAAQCREQLLEGVQREASEHPCLPEQRCIILSGGVDTCCVLEAAQTAGVAFGAAITVVTSATASDRAYACAIAQQHGLKHHLIEIALSDLLTQALPLCVRTLQTFDGMELRNAMVVAVALQRAAELGFRQAWTGDAADELLGGYSFTWRNTDDEAWCMARAKMCAEWTFSAPRTARALGLSAHSVYMRDEFTRWALEATRRADCIAEAATESVPGGERTTQTTGKLPLRRTFADKALSAWRRKDPIEVGSGSTRLSQNEFWAEQVPADELAAEQERLLAEEKVTVRDAEHLVYWRAFKREFPDGIAGRKRFADLPCNGCGYELSRPTALFCHVCGAYPAQEVAAKA